MWQIDMVRECDNYKTDTGVNCVLSSFSNNARLYNQNIDDSYIFFLMNGFDIEYKETCFDNVYEIIFSHFPDRLVEKFMQRYSIKYSYYVSDSFNAFLDWIKTKLQNGSPVLVMIYSNNLEYSISFRNNNNQPHAINIIGYNDSGLLISDCFIPSIPPKTYEGVIQYDNLEKIWNDKETGLIKIYDICYDKVFQDICMTDKLILDSLHNNFVHYFDMNYEMSYLKALYNLCDNLERVFLDTVDVKETASLLASKFNLESIIPARKLLKKCITRLSATTMIKTDILQEIEELIGKWQLIEYKLLMAGLRNNVNYFQIVVDIMRKLIETEKILFQEIDFLIERKINL